MVLIGRALYLMTITFCFCCFSEFLAEGCLSEINVSAEIKKECMEDMKTPSRYAFTSAKVSLLISFYHKLS